MQKLIYLITEGKLTAENFQQQAKAVLDIIAEAVSVGVPLVQIREKRLPARLLFDLTKQAVSLRRDRTKILVNDRADVALLSGADGVHLTSQSIPVRALKAKFPSDFLIGASCHEYEECERTAQDGADFVVFGPVFSTPGKPEPKGIEALSYIAEKLKPFPVIGLGGICEENYRAVLQVSSGFAAIRFLNNKENLRRLYAKGLFDDSRS